MKVAEFFAGSRSIGKAFEEKGHNVFSIDWEPYENIDLVGDVESISIKDLPWTPDVIWASPDCKTYSIAAVSTHRDKRIIPKSDYAKKCDKVNLNFIKIIKECLSINPNLVFFIENPRGMLRHMPFMQQFTRYTIWYCQYGDNRAKPTDIWTNSKEWRPKLPCRNYKYDKDGVIINKHCHHESARRGAKTGTQGLKGSYTRSIIPKLLCEEIVALFTPHSC